MTRAGGAAVSVVVGPDEHGVVEHALAVAAATGSGVHRLPDGPTVPFLAGGVADAAVAHLHYTDRLYGPNSECAADGFCELASRLTGRIVVSLHDVPDPDSSGHSARRVAAYRRVSERADLLIVASTTEQERLRRCGIDGDSRVVPLPIGPIARCRPPDRLDGRARVVGVLGFIYPGKGHAEVIAAAARAQRKVTVWAIGRPSDGHDDVAAALERQAATLARHFVVTGFVDAAELADLLGTVDVPVVPTRRPSASASLNRWIAAGRRPLVAANPYSCELAAAAPDLITLYEAERSGSLDDAIATAVDDPAWTWRAGEVPDKYTIAGVARAHLRVYEQFGGRS